MTRTGQGSIELEASAARVLVDPVGSRITSLVVDGVELLVAPGSDRLLSGCYPMVPWAGRLGHGRFDFAGSTHRLSIDDQPHALHGLGTNQRWNRSSDGEGFTLDLAGLWPLGGVATTEFALSPDRLAMTLRLRAGPHALPVVLGWHPCFRRRLAGASAAPLDLSFSAASMYERGDDHLPTGRMVLPPPGPWDDCFAGVSGAPVLRWPDGPRVTLTAATDTWVVFDEQDHAVCVEPQTGPPDAFNLARAVQLGPGQTADLTLTVVWMSPTS